MSSFYFDSPNGIPHSMPGLVPKGKQVTNYIMPLAYTTSTSTAEGTFRVEHDVRKIVFKPICNDYIVKSTHDTAVTTHFLTSNILGPHDSIGVFSWASPQACSQFTTHIFGSPQRIDGKYEFTIRNSSGVAVVAPASMNILLHIEFHLDP